MKHKPMLVALIYSSTASQPEASPDRLLGKYLRIASWLKADLHLLLSQDIRPRVEEELRRVHEPSTARPVTLDLIQKDYLRETLDTIGRLSADYLCFEDGEFSGAGTPSGRLKQSLLEQAPVPVVILPRRIPEQEFQFENLVVPISGEQIQSEALTESLKLAQETHANVTLIHVAGTGEYSFCDAAGLETVADESHHEYARQLDKIVSEGSPSSSLKQRRLVTQLTHLSGGASESISEFIKQKPESILVLEWKGVLIDGHAETLKTLLRVTRSPVVIVKVAAQSRSKLRIGPDFEAA